VVTDDNPRSEDPATIRQAVLAGCARVTGDAEVVEVADRADAISESIWALGHGDVLVLAGKGHEQGQIIGNTVRPFDDAAVAREAVAELTREGA
jgi:UDP-N-acetylmuramoyl-L-alanyl-D-glutamate--2,6-diaminopimelate ligase